MKEIFWLALAMIAYTYLGYPLWLRVIAGIRPRPVNSGSVSPRLSVVMAVHNEERNLSSKLANLERLRYPRVFQRVIVSDGSTDRTNQILASASGVDAVVLPEALGKAAALNAGFRVATGDILVFLDARQEVADDALVELVSFFADESVGAVSGELLLESTSGAPRVGLYWKIEKLIRRLESASGSVVGVTGAIYALRRELYTSLPEGAILDDVLTPMRVVRAGKRVVFCSTATARDRVFPEKGREFRRRVRTLTGNFQLFRLAPWLLSPRNPILFRFISHKVLRLIVPWFLVVLAVSAALAHGMVYKAALLAQLIFYGLAVAGWLSPRLRRLPLVGAAETFTMLNLAAALAFYNFVTRREKVWL